MSLEIRFGNQNFANYRRLAYKWWYALAEFVDNSTQSYQNNGSTLDESYRRSNDTFSVVITTDQDFVRIHDNAMGMDLSDLERAMIVGLPPDDISGRSRYGLGMKTAACWIGNRWKIITSKLGNPIEYTVDVDVNEIIQGRTVPPMRERAVPSDEHYTAIEITDHHRPLQGRTIGKVKQHLESIYRADISEEIMILRYNDEELKWRGFVESDFLKRKDGSIYKKDFIFEINGDSKKIVFGWVGILDEGSRAKAGFSILHRKRLIKGWPDSWRPEKIYGHGGRNDLINQRLVGEANLEDFEVSHTKDEINWAGMEEEDVEGGLLVECKPFMEVARKRRVNKPGTVGPAEVHVDSAVRTVEEELATPQFLEALQLAEALPPAGQIEASNQHVLQNASRVDPTFTVALKALTIRVFIDAIGSPNDPYFVNDDADDENLTVVVNRQHPHWQMLEGENAVVNYLRHCVYDGVAEHRAARLHRVESDSVKKLKDMYLRVAFDLLQATDDEDD